MNLNEYGYSRDYAHECVAWTGNASHRARKRCGLPVTEDIGGWIYLCTRHYAIIEREFEQRIETIHTVQVANMERRLEALHLHEQVMLAASKEKYEFTEEDYERRRRAQTVYFLRCEQFVKIGVSFNPERRLAQIRKGGGTSFPRRLDIATAELVITEPGGFNRESELHAKFAHLRDTGEWFREAPELTAYIDALTEGRAAA